MKPQPSQSYITAQWSNMAVMNFVVDPALLIRYLPRGLELSPYENKHLLSLVGFQFQNTRMGRFAVPFYGDFIELFLAFFARRQVQGRERRAWLFIRKIVPSSVVATVGRTLYREDYIRRPMRAVFPRNDPGASPSSHVRYEWQNRGRWNYMDVSCHNSQPHYPQPGSIEHFVTDNYGGFSLRKDTRGIEFPVEHPPWQVRPAHDARLDCDVEELYGAEFAPALRSTPHSAFVASGSLVSLGKASTFG
jgi:uncharacterized protein YqjF (DUF2071 family)